MHEPAIEIDGNKVHVLALSREGVWLRLFTIDTSSDEIWNVYRVPLLLKIECAGQEAQLYDREVADCSVTTTPQDKQS